MTGRRNELRLISLPENPVVSYPALWRIVVGIVVIMLSSLVTSADVHAQRSSEGVFSAVLVKDGKTQSVCSTNPDDVVRLIVSFKDQPLALRHRKQSLQKSSVSTAFASLQSGHSGFRAALAAIGQQLSALSHADFSYSITHEYYRALNGVALQCKRGMIARIRELPTVKSISLDREVKADLTASVHQIRADIVQDSLGYTGKGVLVGEVDSGIDYNNPALGGGFGPAYRVIGGYDFVNSDTDPMDDAGHGTHVAGIIGASNGDSLRGVAPDVKFLAAKVLDADGSGSASNVIAGVEYCLDPDNNPATDDAADVINMSLGGTPVPDDPLDSAVANATKAGVLCVVAAGNSAYLGYGSIESPGTCESALTVGATVAPDAIAGFSSLGPDPIYSSIKPDVVAPGVLILSTALNNQTASWSGTSMATPHVAGLAALLEQEHPSWTPEDVKAAIINSAVDVGEDVSVFAQGRGCVDALNAATARLVVEPGIISCGMVDVRADVWRDTVEMTIRNFRSTSQEIQIRVDDGLPAGAMLAFENTSFSLAPGEGTSIMGILTVPSSVPLLTQEPFAYTGHIDITSDSDNVVVPFGFLKSSKLVVTCDAQPTMITVLDRTTGTIVSNLGEIPEGVMKFSYRVAKEDSLEILAVMEQQDSLGVTSYYVVDRGIANAEALTYAPLGLYEATIDLMDTISDTHNTMVPRDSIAALEIALRLSLQNADYLWGLSTGTKSRIFISPLDSAILVEKVVFAKRDTDLFILRKCFSNLRGQQDVTIGSGAENLVGYHVGSCSYEDPSLGTPPSNLQETIVAGLSTSWWTSRGASIWAWSEQIISVGNLYVNKQEGGPGVQGASVLTPSMYLGMRYWPDQHVSFRTPDFTIGSGGEAVFGLRRTTQNGSSTEVLFESLKPGDTIRVDQRAHVSVPDCMTYIRHGSLFLHSNNDWFPLSSSYGGTRQGNGAFESRDASNPSWMMPLFHAQAFSRNRVLVNMKPFLRNQYILYDDFDKQYAYYEFANMQNCAGTLRLLCDAPTYAIVGQAGQCTADFEYQISNNLVDNSVGSSINLLQASAVFPSFNLLQVSVDGRAVDVVRPDQHGTIRLMLFDPDSSATSVTLSLRLASGDEVPLSVTSVGGGEYDGALPVTTPSGFIDIVARVGDAKGDSCELVASPGFFSGSSTDSRKLDGRLRMNSYVLDNAESITAAPGDTLRYTLSYINYGSDTARNVVVSFPTTPYFRPVGSPAWTVESVGIGDTIHIPVSVVFLGKQKPTESVAHYAPSVNWTSGGTAYHRTHNVLVDFRNSITNLTPLEDLLPEGFALYQNFPNPFNSSTTIAYDLPRDTPVHLVVFDLLGREVATLVNETGKAGRHQAVWNANGCATGAYFYRLQAGDFHITKRTLLLK